MKSISHRNDYGYASIETAVAATKQGAYDFLAKPFTPTNCETPSARQLSGLRSPGSTQLATNAARCGFSSSGPGHELKSPSVRRRLPQLVQNRTLGNDLGAYEEVLRRGRDRIQGMFKLIATSST